MICNRWTSILEWDGCLFIPMYIELLIRIEIVNLYLDKDIDKYLYWLTDAILNIPGNYPLQKIIADKKKNHEYISVSEFIANGFFI